jgi:DmsE family decaheme c-type cytochrome
MTPHGHAVLKTNGTSADMCEACHGPGSAHVEGGGDKSKIFRFAGTAPAAISAQCLACHGESHTQGNFRRSMHFRNGVACTDCHSPHKPKQQDFLLVAKTPQLCYSCHSEIKPDFSKPFHHKVNENLVSCTDCHDAHGENVRQLRASARNDMVCFKCHSDIQGPFIYEHEPVRTEGCTVCHTPHGATTPRMLKRANVNLLCLGCHSNSFDTRALSATPPSRDTSIDAPVPIGPAHNQAQRYQDCLQCHAFIHGSNTSNVFFKP